MDESFAVYDVWGEYLEETTNHRVADVFWNYLNSWGTVQYGDELFEDRLFDPWFYATGLPVTEAYWSEVTVAGTVLDVLTQCFERRCLTYTPSNDPGWRVEMGNVGLHYYEWRYSTDEPEPEPEPPSAEVLYEATLAEWPVGPLGIGDVSVGESFVEDGAYHMLITDAEGNAGIVFAPVGDLEDITVTVEVRSTGESDDSEACLVSRVTESTLAGYWFCIDSAGETFAFYRGEGEDGDVVSLLERALRAQTHPVSEWNVLGIRTVETDITFEINGQIAGVTFHDGPAMGTVGIAVSNRADEPAEYAFRNLLVESATLSS